MAELAEEYNKALINILKLFSQKNERSMRNIERFLEREFKHSKPEFLNSVFSNKKILDLDSEFVKKCLLRVLLTDKDLYHKVVSSTSEPIPERTDSWQEIESREVPQSIHRYAILRKINLDKISQVTNQKPGLHNQKDEEPQEVGSHSRVSLMDIMRSMDRMGYLLSKISLLRTIDEVAEACTEIEEECSKIDVASCTLIIARILSKFRQISKAPSNAQSICTLLTCIKRIHDRSIGVVFPAKLNHFLIWCRKSGSLDSEEEKHSKSLVQVFAFLESTVKEQDRQRTKALEYCHAIKQADALELKKIAKRLSRELQEHSEKQTCFGPFTTNVMSSLRKHALQVEDIALQKKILKRIEDSGVCPTGATQEQKIESMSKKKRHRDLQESDTL